MTTRNGNENDDMDQIPRNNYIDRSPRNDIVVRGCSLAEYYLQFADDIENFEVWDDDIWLCGLAKSGTTWAQEMVWCIGNDIDLEAAKASHQVRFPMLELSTLFPPNEREQCGTMENTVEFAKNLQRPRYIKSHLPFQLLPRQIRTGEKKVRIIYVVRNPKDVCISFFHYFNLLGLFRGDLHDHCNFYLDGKAYFGPFWDHILSFWTRRNEPNILFLRFEDMKADLPGMIRKTATFMGKGNISDENMKRLVDHLSFDSMRKNPFVNHEMFIQKIQKYNNTEGDDGFVRSGEVNQWKERMSPDAIARFDQIYKEQLGHTDLGYDN